MHKLRTVDVWDTLLRRDCHPECIKLATARHLLLAQGAKLLPAYSSHWPLYQARLASEQALAQQARAEGHDDEYEIAEVISNWLANVAAGAAAIPVIGPLLVAYELEVEIARSYADGGIHAFLQNHPAERTLFLSDFYMPSAMVARLLQAKGFAGLVADGMASCDVRLNKRSGSLFSYVHKTLGVAPDQHVHIGDNPWSDVEAAHRLGIQAIHYLPEQAHAQRLQREALFSSRNTLFAHMAASTSVEADQLFSGAPADDAQAAVRLGMEAAPLFLGFSMWVAEQSLRHRLDRILFFTREGDFFHQVYTSLFPDGCCAGHPLPQASILPVSRLATFAASLHAPTFDEISRCWTTSGQQRISALFLQLGLDVSDFAALLAKHRLAAGDLVNAPSGNGALRRLLEEPEVTDALVLSMDRNKSLLRALLEQHGVERGMNVGIVDIGWRGTIQDNIARALPDVHFHGMYLGLRDLKNQQPANVTKEAYGPNENADHALNGLFEVFSVLEMLCMSPHGSVSGYHWVNQVVHPLRDISAEENQSFVDFTSHFQAGVVFATERWRPLLDAYSVAAHELLELGLKVWEGLRSAPPQHLAFVFNHSPQHDIFGFGEIYSRSQVPSLATICLSPFRKAQRQTLVAFVRRVQWSAAIESRRDLAWVHRAALLLTFRLANRIKLFRMKARHKRASRA